MGCWNAVGQLCIVLNCCRIITFRAVQQLSACSSSCSHFGTCQTKRRINTRSRFLLEPSTKPEYVSETRRNELNRDFMMPIWIMAWTCRMLYLMLRWRSGWTSNSALFTSTDAMQHYPLFLHPLWWVWSVPYQYHWASTPLGIQDRHYQDHYRCPGRYIGVL